MLWKQLMQIVGQTWLNLVTWTCMSWSEGQHDLYFTVQWFCLISWSLFDVCTSYFGIMNQYDPRFDFKVNVGHCDLYFMVQWFGLISWRLFDLWTSLLGIMNQYDPTFDIKKDRSMWSIFHGPVISRYIYEHHTLGLWVSMTRRSTSKKMYVFVTYISWSSDFVLYLKHYLMHECHIFR